MRVVAEVMGWWIALTASWVATLSEPAAVDLLVGASAALLCTIVAVPVRRAVGGRWRPRARWLTWLGPLAVAVPSDTVRLLTRAAPRLIRDRDRGGRMRQLPSPALEPAPEAAYRRAWGTLVLSAAPGTVVVDWPPDGSPVVHALASGPPRMDRVVIG